MLGKARLASIFPVCIVLVLFLQGCPASGGGGDDDDADPAGAPRVALSTTTGDTFLLANGTDSTTIQLTATDANGRGLAGLAVTFTTTAGTLSASAPLVAARANGESATVVTTNANGLAQATLTSSPTPATATVAARVDTGGGTAVAPSPMTIDFISDVPAQLTLRAVPQPLVWVQRVPFWPP
jgi:hypothetical protein